MKLDKAQLKAKKKYHEKRVEFYSKKLEEANKKEKRIGFIHYD